MNSTIANRQNAGADPGFAKGRGHCEASIGLQGQTPVGVKGRSLLEAQSF